MRVWENVPGPEIGDGKGPARRYDAMDVADALDVSTRSRTISQLTSFRMVRATALLEGAAIRMQGFGVSGGFFDMLGVQAQLGRTFAASDASSGYERYSSRVRTWSLLGVATGSRPDLTFSDDRCPVARPYRGGPALARQRGLHVIGVSAAVRFPATGAQFCSASVTPPATAVPTCRHCAPRRSFDAGFRRCRNRGPPTRSARRAAR